MPTYNPHTDNHSIEKYQFLHHFLPHPETKKKARLLSHKAMAIYAMVIVSLFVGFKAVPKILPGVLGYASNIAISDLLRETNDMRAKNGLETLRLNSALTEAAEKKAEHMFENGYWAHVAPDGTEPWDFILGEDYDYLYAGENLAKNFNHSDDVVEAWFRSPSHKDNLFSSNYDEIGFAVVNGILDGYETTLVVQMFGRPRNPSLVASVYEEETLLESFRPIEVPTTERVAIAAEEPNVLPVIDVSVASKSISLVIGGFLIVLLALDIWYTKRKAIPKVTGNAFAHMLILAITLLGVWVVLVPGKIL